MAEDWPILHDVEPGDAKAASALLPTIYDELRRLAARRLAREAPGQTLQPTALVHEAYLKLAADDQPKWSNRRHFFAAAAEAMRCILIDHARRRSRGKHGGGRKRVDLADVNLTCDVAPDELLRIDEAISKLAREDACAAQLVRLRYYTGLSIQEAAEMVGLSRSSGYEHWSYARAWLHCELQATR
jgi:RNA polymerase sigma factor (TIGR02999 family)